MKAAEAKQNQSPCSEIPKSAFPKGFVLNITAPISFDRDSRYFVFLIRSVFPLTQPFWRAIPKTLPLPPASGNPPQTRSSIAARVPDEQ